MAVGLFVLTSGGVVAGQDIPVNAPLMFPQNSLANVLAPPPQARMPVRLEVVELADNGRPAPLGYIYASYAAFQVGDVVTTSTGLQIGAQEKNPFVGGIASSPWKFSLIKLGATAATVYAVESLWRNGHRKGAIVAMLAATAISGVVLANNMRVLSKIK